MTNLEHICQEQSEQVQVPIKTTPQEQANISPVGTVQHNLENIRPTVSEINHLWSNYLAESMSIAILKHMVAKSKDPDFHDILQTALDISSQNLNDMGNLFAKIQHPIPEGFGENDVDLYAPELFAEAYSVRYTRLMVKYIFQTYSLAFSDSSRSDFRNLFSKFTDNSKNFIKKADVVLLEKGLFPKSPYIEFPDSVEYVTDKNYMGSFFGGSERQLNVVEISNIFNIMDYEMAMRALKMGFAQVAKSNKIKKHFRRGLEIADKQLEILGALLVKDSLPAPEFVNFQVTDSTKSPYSDRIMLFHTTAALARIIMVYGLALSNSSRKDVVLTLSRLMAEIMEFSKDGAKLLIENGWLERAPETANRQNLVH